MFCAFVPACVGMCGTGADWLLLTHSQRRLLKCLCWSLGSCKAKTYRIYLFDLDNFRLLQRWTSLRYWQIAFLSFVHKAAFLCQQRMNENSFWWWQQVSKRFITYAFKSCNKCLSSAKIGRQIHNNKCNLPLNLLVYSQNQLIWWDFRNLQKQQWQR